MGITCAVVVVVGGCQASATKVAPPELPTVPVSRPVQRDVTDYVDFTGQTKAVYSADIRPRVTGYLVSMHFKEGEEVKKDDLLFIVDPRPYKAQLDQAQGQVNLYQAQLKLARTNLARDRAANAQVPGSISPQQFDQEQAVVDEAKARVEAFQKSMEIYRLSHEFTRVLSPIDGQISRYYLTLGNLVNQDQTLLTTVMSVDPMHVYFEMDEPTLLRTRRAVNEGKVKLPEDRTFPVFMGLQGEEGFPHEGTINFVNNQVNPTTGSILVRGVFPNPQPKGGHRLLSPGMFARIRMPIGVPHPALLVIDRAVGSDQGLKYVYVLVACELRLMPSVTDVGDVPTEGKRLLIVADVNHVLHFRTFDPDGKLVVDTNEKELAKQGRQIESIRKQVERQIEALKNQLRSLWPPHQLTTTEKELVSASVTAIVGHPIEYRRVATGALEDDGLRVIEEGLEPDDWIVSGGLLQVRPRMVVRPERVPMPTLGLPPGSGPESRPEPKTDAIPARGSAPNPGQPKSDPQSASGTGPSPVKSKNDAKPTTEKATR
jgi:multidrug efflux system membrane fusion protein